MTLITSSNKEILKKLRKTFNHRVMRREDGICAIPNCGFEEEDKLEVHHITSRKLMPNHGYTELNGIALCPACHLAAEAAFKNPNDKFKAETLYKIINSSYEQAYKASEELCSPIIWPKTN